MNASAPGTATDLVAITLPARADYIAVARLAVAGLAGRLGMSVDDSEDLKLVLGEACNAAIMGGANTLAIRFEVGSARLIIRVAYTGTAENPPSRERELGMLFMRCLVDEVRTRRNGTRQVLILTKHLQ